MSIKPARRAKPIECVFFGSGVFAANVLQELHSCTNIKIKKVFSTPKPKSRQLKNKGVWSIAKTVTFSDWDNVCKRLKKINPELVILADFGKMVPKKALNLVKGGWWNVHASLLPKYRGAVPIQAALLAGEAQVGVTVFKMGENLDDGPILAQKAVNVLPSDDTEILIKKLSFLGAEILCKYLPMYLSNKLELKPQKGASSYCYISMLKRENAQIDWRKKSSDEILNMVRAYVPDPCAWTKLGGKDVKILKVKQVSAKSLKGQPGTAINTKEGVFVKCKKGWLKLEKVAVSGKGKMHAKAFGNGYVRKTAIFK